MVNNNHWVFFHSRKGIGANNEKKDSRPYGIAKWPGILCCLQASAPLPHLVPLSLPVAPQRCRLPFKEHFKGTKIHFSKTMTFVSKIQSIYMIFVMF